MFTFLELTVHQHVAADRRRRFRDAGRRSRRHRTPVAPDLIRTADLVPTVLPVAWSGSALRVDPASASSVAVGG